MEEMLSYLVPIASAVISGLASYLAARKNCDAEIQKLRESNAHDIERLLKQHEIDIDALKESHRLEMEKAESDHKHALELANNATQNQVAAQILTSVVGSAFSSPEMTEELIRQIKHTAKSDN